MRLPGYELSDHARDVIAEREIETTWVVRVLSKPYNASVNPPRIVTVYFDRRQRGKT